MNSAAPHQAPAAATLHGDPDGRGAAMHRLIEELFPLCRSLTGEGVRTTLRRLQALIPLELREVSSGTPVLDWTVPAEWNLRDAWIKNARGEKVLDVGHSNLHVVGYSQPVHRRMPLTELKPHLYTLPDHPDWTPYRTTYYQESWGFCLPHRTLWQWPDGEYEVCIDATLAPGSLTYGELVLPGQRPDEVLFSTHICHPSLANDNLSGIAVATFLAQALARQPARRYTYRFLFLPGTIGAIAWLAQHAAEARRIRHGLVLAGVGDAGPLHYKRSHQGDAEIDRVVARVLKRRGRAYQLLDFIPYGYDERQFGSPGFDLPVGCLMRTPFGTYPEYHTSADNLDLVQPDALASTLTLLEAVCAELEGAERYLNLQPHGEPQLGRRGLYEALGGGNERQQRQLALLWVLSYSDGRHSLADIAEQSGLPQEQLREAAALLARHDLVKPLD